MRSSGQWWALTAILLLGAVMRITHLVETPPGPSPDEASCAVDARWIGLSGRDRHGEAFPLYPRGLDDYRDAAFTYLAVPLVLTLSDSLLAIRSLAVAIGLATVFLTYLLGKRLFGEPAGRWAALFLAVNPQHVLWSRLGMEVILTPLVMIISLIAFDQARRWPRFGPLATAASLLAVIYSGPMGKPLAVILAVVYLACLAGRREQPLFREMALLAGLVVLAIGSIPAWLAIFRGTGGIARYRQIGLRADSVLGYLIGFTQNYVTYFSPRYLLFPQGGGAPDLPFAGKIGYTEFGCVLAGLVFLCRDRPRSTRLVVLLLILFAIPAATTRTIASDRVLFGMPIFCLVAGWGASRLSLPAKGRRPWIIGALVAGSLVTAGMTMGDLLTTTRPHLDLFFYGPSRRLVAAAVAARHPDDRVILDPRIPYANLYFLDFAKPPVRGDRSGRVFVVPPSRALQAIPDLEGIFITTVAERIPGASIVYREGPHCVKVRRAAGRIPLAP